MHISIIISTRNRCSDLSRAIDSIEDAPVPEGSDCEIVIVDNGSTDKTRSLCSAIAKRSRKSLRYVYEPRRGKSTALNAAVRAAQGDILAFTDDDCIVDANWIMEIVREFASDKHLAVLSGQVRLYDRRDISLTIVDAHERIEITSPSMLFPTPMVIGANMALIRGVFTRIGAFDVYMGPGTSAVCEDVDLVYRAIKSGFKAVFSDNVVVYHNHGRRTVNEADAVLHKYHIGRGAFYFKHMNNDRKVAKMAVCDVCRALAQLCTLIGVRWNLRFLWALLRGGSSRITSWFGNRWYAAKTREFDLLP